MPLLIDDWETSETVRRLTYEGEGIYCALLRHQWRHGSIPRSEADIREILRLRDAQYPLLMQLVSGAFPVQRGRRANRKLRQLRTAALDKANQGKEMALMRWHKARIAQAVPRQSPPIAIQSQSQNQITATTKSKAFPGKRNGRVMPKTYDYTPGVKGPAI